MDKKLFTELMTSVKEMKEIQAGKRKSGRQLAALGGSQPHLKPIRRRRAKHDPGRHPCLEFRKEVRYFKHS